MDLSLDLQVRAKTQKAKSLEPEPNELNQTTNLTSCLKTFTSCEKLQPDAYTCTSHICGGQPQRASKELGIKKLPPVLCMQLKVRATNSVSSERLRRPLTLAVEIRAYERN